jgi:NTP pyrophosphatase (non-canonical NTP hydrolase)
MRDPESTPITLAPDAPMRAYQTYIHQLEAMHGWLDVDLVHSCFLMGEEVGELFKAVRKHLRYFEEHDPSAEEASRQEIGDELVDVLNYLLAVANRLNIDVEEAFRRKNLINQGRTWSSGGEGAGRGVGGEGAGGEGQP